LVPVVRTLISVPAGFAKMPLHTFLLYSAAGTFLWTALLAYAGRWLGSQFPQIGHVIGIVTWVVIGAAALRYAEGLGRLRRRQVRAGVSADAPAGNDSEPAQAPFGVSTRSSAVSGGASRISLDSRIQRPVSSSDLIPRSRKFSN